MKKPIGAYRDAKLFTASTQIQQFAKIYRGPTLGADLPTNLPARFHVSSIRDLYRTRTAKLPYQQLNYDVNAPTVFGGMRLPHDPVLRIRR